MISRTKNPAPSSPTATLSDCSVVTTTSLRVDLAAHRDHADSSQPAIASKPESGTPDVDPIFLAQEVCQMLKIGKTTLYKLDRSKNLKSFRITARIRAWRLSTIRAYLASKEAQ